MTFEKALTSITNDDLAIMSCGASSGERTTFFQFNRGTVSIHPKTGYEPHEFDPINLDDILTGVLWNVSKR